MQVGSAQTPRHHHLSETAARLQAALPDPAASAEPGFKLGEIIVKYDPDKVRLCPIAVARAGTSFVEATGNRALASLDRVHQRHGLKPAQARKLFRTPEPTGSLVQDRARARRAFEAVKSKVPGRRAPSDTRFVDLSSIYVVPCTPGQETAAVAALNQDPAIEYAELNCRRHTTALPDDTYVDPDQDGVWSIRAWEQDYPDLWGMKRIGADYGWASNVHGEGVVVAVLDTGVDYNHEDIADRMWINQAEAEGVAGVDDDANGYVDDVHGYNFAYSTADPMDDQGHGTHCAGTIAAARNSVGVVGVVPGASIMAVKGLDVIGVGLDTTLAEAVQYAADNGAAVLNCSWGAYAVSMTLTDAFHYAHALGCICVAAAGNDNYSMNYFAPANIDTVIAVAAVDHLDHKYPTSNWGTLLDVAAPGADILSLRAAGTDFAYDGQHFVPPGDINARYYRSTGTSMACPHVSGLAAWITVAAPQFDNDAVRKTIRDCADDLGSPGFDVYFGHGRINAAQIINYLTDCNENGVGDDVDIVAETSGDCNSNGIPDECEQPDCNSNGLPDECDLTGGTSNDCNSNGIPDECIHNERDCNHNGIPDECDIAAGTCTDDNGDGFPDICQETLHVPGAQYPTIQSAIDAADDGDTVLVANGTYREAGNKDLDFGGRLITLRSAGGAANCIIDCGGSGRGFHFHNGETLLAQVDGFTIVNGSDDWGGGVFCEFSSPTITNCVISGNTANFSFGFYSGGGVFAMGTSLVITNCTVSDNTAWGSGGGICLVGGIGPRVVDCTVTGNTSMFVGGGVVCHCEGNAVISGCTVTNNQAWRTGGVDCAAVNLISVSHCTISGNSAGAGGGGGIRCGGGNTAITNCTITANTSPTDGPGGGIKCIQCSPTISDCIISGNSGGRGGGIACDDSSSPTIRNCTITDNTAERGGGVYCYDYSSPIISNSLITGNSSHNFAGGIGCSNGSSPIVGNCIIADNTSFVGGGVFCHSIIIPMHIHSSPTFTNCTITGNTAGEGGGVFCQYDSSPSFHNSILWGNTAFIGPEICLRIGDSSLNLEYCTVQGAEEEARLYPGTSCNWGDGVIDHDPRFVDSATGDYHLLPASPCINTGDPQFSSAPEESDIDGEARVSLGIVDIGADEARQFTDCNNNAIPDGKDIAHGTASDCNNNLILDECDLSGGSSYDCNNNGVPDECELDRHDCNTNSIPDDCDIQFGTSTDCTADGIPDECEPDCNGNNIADSCDLAGGTSGDCNTNGVPDECEPNHDCNNNGIWDICDISVGTSRDCDMNGIPDQCQPLDHDCNSNGIFDECDIAAATSADCNVNGVPDECDLIAGTSPDCTGNGVPDECESDCNTNGIADSCDIAAGTSLDDDQDGIPDECTGVYLVPSQYPTIQAAIDATQVGEVVLVASGVYRGQGNKDLDFGGKLIEVRSQYGPTTCIIDCGGAGRGFHFHSRETWDALVQGFTIRNGHADLGGAVRCDLARPTITDCIIVDNEALQGGAIYGYYSTPWLINCVVSGNTATGPYSLGGAIHCDYSTCWFEDCVISGNTANRGGAAALWRSRADFNRCVFSANTAAVEGGAMHCSGRSNPWVAGCIFVANQADRGGGVYNTDESAPMLINCTLSNNSAARGGGMTNESGDPSITDSILWGNRDDRSQDESAQIDITGGAVVMDYCCIQGWTGLWGGIGNIGGEAEDNPLFVDADNGDVHLLPLSPCIDAGDP
ncbi:MAG: S8 family serine peptidase, partial [Phycisphaerae bacterium]|nr:S8 family serine peptidase [Phycisphaerae bacterium]